MQLSEVCALGPLLQLRDLQRLVRDHFDIAAADHLPLRERNVIAAQSSRHSSAKTC